MEKGIVQYSYSCPKCLAFGYSPTKIEKCPECGNKVDLRERALTR